MLQQTALRLFPGCDASRKALHVKLFSVIGACERRSSEAEARNSVRLSVTRLNSCHLPVYIELCCASHDSVMIVVSRSQISHYISAYSEPGQGGLGKTYRKYAVSRDPHFRSHPISYLSFPAVPSPPLPSPPPLAPKFS